MAQYTKRAKVLLDRRERVIKLMAQFF